MNRLLVLIACLFAGAGLAEAQAPLVFSASDLARISLELTGSENGWPAVNKLAVYDPASNSFRLDEKALALLRDYRDATIRRDNSRKKYIEEVAAGAKVYAPDQLVRCDSLYDLFMRHTIDGKVREAVQLVPVIQAAVEQLGVDNRRNRVVKVEARLVERQGRVDRKKSALGNWQEAASGEGFAEEDGIRTQEASVAKLAFGDGSTVTLGSTTTAIIRHNRVDQFNAGTETEVVLNSGTAVTATPVENGRPTEFKLKAGSTTSTVKSRRFWAGTDGDDQVALANYDGTVVVKSPSGSVTLNANEGAVVRRGRDPLQIVKLLTAPQWRMAGSDTTVYSESLQIGWTEVAGAASYQVEISQSRGFENAVRSFQGTGTAMRMNSLALGVNYVRVRAYDSRGLRGNDSPVYTVLRNPDVIPPPLLLDNDVAGAVYVAGNEFYCSGITERGARLVINGESVDVDPSGRFGVMVQLDSRINKVEFMSIDPTGNRTAATRLIVRMSQEQMYKIDWTVPSREEGQIRRADQIGVMGTAYAPVKVVVKVGRQQYETDCKPNGTWELYFNVPADARSVDIRFIVKATGQEIGRKSFLLY